MQHNFDEIIPRRGTNSYKWDSATDPNVLPMWVADMDFHTAPAVTEALKKRVEHGIFGYVRVPDAYYNATINWFKRRHDWRIEKEWIIYTSGVVPALSAIIKALTGPGDKVLVQTPVYNCFFSSIRNNGCEMISNPLIYEDNTYRIDFDDLEKKLKDPRTKLFFMSNPHNPAMRCFTLEELKRIGELCLKYNVLVISDEIHCDLTYQGYKHIPFGSISEEFANNCIVLINPSKTFNIAGFRTGAAIIPNKRIRDNIEITIVNNKNYGRTIFGMLTFVTAYTQCDYYADEMMQYLQQSRDMMMAYMKERIPRIKLAEPEATYLMWLDCRDLNMTQDELKAFMFNKAKLGLNDGATFGTGGTGFMRMNIACPRSTVEQALEQLEKAVNAL